MRVCDRCGSKDDVQYGSLPLSLQSMADQSKTTLVDLCRRCREELIIVLTDWLGIEAEIRKDA